MNNPFLQRRATFVATLAMVLTAAIWGFAFVAQKTAADHLQAFSLNGTRFILGGLTIGCYRWLNQRRIAVTQSELRNGTILGIFLFGAVTLQQIGIETTTASKAGFITGLYLVFVPLFMTLFWAQRASRRLWIATTTTLAGLYLLSVTRGLEIESGDLLIFLCAVIFALHIIYIGRYARKTDPVTLSMVQLFFCGFLSSILSVFFETPQLSDIRAAWLELAYMGVLSAGIAYTLQVVAQRYVSPVLAGVIMSLEALFAALGGVILLDESFTQRQLAGSLLMLIGFGIAQLEGTDAEKEQNSKEQVKTSDG